MPKQVEVIEVEGEQHDQMVSTVEGGRSSSQSRERTKREHCRERQYNFDCLCWVYEICEIYKM